MQSSISTDRESLSPAPADEQAMALLAAAGQTLATPASAGNPGGSDDGDGDDDDRDDSPRSDKPNALTHPVDTEHAAAIQRTVTRLRKLRLDAAVDLHLAVGRIIVEELYSGDVEAYTRRDRKTVSLRRLASEENLGFSASMLSRSVAMYRLHQEHDLTQFPPLSAHKLRAIIQAAPEERLRLLQEAAATASTPAPAPLQLTAEEVPSALDAAPPRTLRALRKRLFTELNHLTKLSDVSKADAQRRIERALSIVDGLREQLRGLVREQDENAII